MKSQSFLLALLLVICQPGWCWAQKKAKAKKEPEAAWLDGFRDGISHWQKQNDKTKYPHFSPKQVREIADNILLYQFDNSGWRPNDDPTRILTPDEIQKLAAEKSKQNTSFDNRNTYTHIEYLAHAFETIGDQKYKDACLRGLEFTFKAQYANGGFPHSYPNKKSYYPHITIQDDVMVGILTVLRKVAAGESPFGFADAALRERSKEAVARGDALLLKLQIRVNGELTAWAGQYDETTLEPCMGRTFELISISCGESVTVVRYLMRIPNPSPEVRNAIESAVRWYEKSKLTGFRIERIPAPTVKYDHHTSRYDVVMVSDPKAAPMWARFYDIETNRPFMANRDGKKVFKLEDVTRERRTGANWFGYYPRDLLAKEYPAWKARTS